MAPTKRKLTNKSLAEKCKALKDLENGLSNKDVATKYRVPRSSVSTKVKNSYASKKKGMSSSRKNTCCGNYDKLDISLFSFYEEEIRSLTLNIETFLNKERTDG